jgi:hypothetical protein
MNDLQHELAPVSDAPRGEALASPPDDKHDAEQRMPGAIRASPRLVAARHPPTITRGTSTTIQPQAGVRRAAAPACSIMQEPLEGARALFVMNHEDGGFDCPGCAWPDDPDGRHLDICENGIKHVTRELAAAGTRYASVVIGFDFA